VRARACSRSTSGAPAKELIWVQSEHVQPDEADLIRRLSSLRILEARSSDAVPSKQNQSILNIMNSVLSSPGGAHEADLAGRGHGFLRGNEKRIAQLVRDQNGAHSSRSRSLTISSSMLSAVSDPVRRGSS